MRVEPAAFLSFVAALVASAACDARPRDDAAGEAEEAPPVAAPVAAPAQALASAPPREASPREPPPVLEAFAMNAARPLRVSWPLDVGPGRGRNRDRPAGRVCIRGRQGANEIQRPGGGRALYGFRVPVAGTYQSHLRVRWLDDGVGSVDCNNSWFAALDDGAPRVVGNDNESTRWHWERGPAARLEAGAHFLRMELREDGVFCDRIAVVPSGGDASAAGLDALPVVEQAGFAGARPPHDPANPVRDVEIAALRTRSVIVRQGQGQRRGHGHVNEITVVASYQGGEAGFHGRVTIECPTARGVSVEGEASITCSPDAPYSASKLALAFPPNAPRRIHYVNLSVVSEGDAGDERVFKRTLSFLKPPAWAFLGPFRDETRGHAGTTAGPGALGQAMAKALAMRPSRGELEAVAKRVAPDARPASSLPGKGILKWQLVEDGSCYDELGAVDMFEVYGRRQNAFAYAVTWIRAETRLNHRSFMFSADDTASLWIAGRLTAVMPATLPREANRLWSSAPLQRGPNPVVVKIAQGGRYWGFRFDVVDWHWQGRRGDAIHGAEPAEWPK